MSGGIAGVVVVVANLVAWRALRAAVDWVVHRLPNRWLGMASSTSYFAAWERERRRTEVGDLLALLCAPLFFLWSPWYAATLVHVYAVGLVLRASSGRGLKMVAR